MNYLWDRCLFCNVYYKTEKNPSESGKISVHRWGQKSHSKDSHQAVFQTVGAAWSRAKTTNRFYMKRYNTANFMTADGRESECSLHSLMMIIKYYLKQRLCYKLSRAGTFLCTAQWNLSPDEVFRIAADCQYKVYNTNNFPLEKLRHSKTYWMLHCNMADGSGFLVELSLFPRFQMDWGLHSQMVLCNDRDGFGNAAQSATISCVFFITDNWSSFSFISTYC